MASHSQSGKTLKEKQQARYHTRRAAAESMQRSYGAGGTSPATSLVPSSAQWVASSHSLPEHLIMLVLKTASLFLPVS